MSETPGKATGRSSARPTDGDKTNAEKVRSDPPDDSTLPSPPFHELVMLLEDISKMSSKKRDFIERYFQAWRKNGFGTMYPVIRLLLPKLDNERRQYGLKESKMADLYISNLKILPGSEPALKLKNWKEGARDSAGDFSLAVRDVVAGRSLVTHPMGHTIQDVNQLLTKLSRKGSEKSDIFNVLVQSYTALENKWIVRIINKDLKIGMSENSVFPCYHPDALELYNVCSELRKTVLDCADPTIKVVTASVNVNHPFKPMLSKRIPTARDVVVSMENQPFWIETKIDGERVQIHKDGENYRYWSRNSTEFTHLYGATPNEGSLTPFIHPLINPKAEKLILDGEMVEYDPATKEVINFGTVKTAGGDHSDSTHKRRPMLYVFDVINMNGASIIEHSLETRREMLNSIIPKESEGRLEILKHTTGTSEQHIVDAIDEAIMGRQEGVIVKNPRSPYIPNGRGEQWVKIKPEYVDGVFDSLDVLIVGGYYGSGTRGGHGVISSYICAVRDNTSKSTTGKKFLTFCKFGSGFTYQQMGKFSQRLGPHWKEFKHYRENPWVDLVDNAKMRPDVIIDPEKSIVVEIKASEILANSESYASEYTVRFPRFLRVREDKDASSCMTMSEVHRMYREFKGKLSMRVVDTNFTKTKTKAKQAGPRKVTQAHLLQAIVGDTSVVKVETDLFKGQVFWVVQGDKSQTKGELEVLIKRFGGRQSQSAQMEKTIIIAGDNGPGVVGLKMRGDKNIVLPTWVRDCVKESRLIPLNPKYMLFTTKETDNEFRLIMDEYEDSYTEPLSTSALQEILNKMEDRSAFVKRKREEKAQERAAKIKIKRLNNLEDQPDDICTGTGSGVGTDRDVKRSLMAMERIVGGWALQDAERARRVTATMTRKYYGKDGETEPPLGMFQGVEVVMIYPPKPEEHLRDSVLKDKKGKQVIVKGEFDLDRHGERSRGGSGTATGGDGYVKDQTMYEMLSKAVDHWSWKRESQREAEFLGSTLTAKAVDRGVDALHWQLVAEETHQQENLVHTLSTLTNYKICRNNLDIVRMILEFHGARVIPQDKCTIDYCQRRLRNRARPRDHLDSSNSSVSDSQRVGEKEEEEEDVGVPLELLILFDPLYLETVDLWRDAMKVSALYGPQASTFEVPRLVTSDWVMQSQKNKYRVPEEGYYPVQ
ncbi:DNA ligase (ATP) [Linnemannia exigua]|uniref:DNA ligase 4 n=1 Tax=Linnemannia exigua TaxID=604196 RepID=A0AAD4D6M7_9FUNG|nr:DNA ligase (ATP) [Linnemannia exigua]